MKQLSALEISFLVSELEKIAHSKLQQVYQPAKKQLVLQFHIRGIGRAALKMRVPIAAYLAEEKETGITGFCSILRKKLNNTILQKVNQPGFERILQLKFFSKNDHFSLIFELFSRGNIILLQDGKIVAVDEKQHWSSRDLKTGQEYKLPPAATDPRTINKNKLLELLKSTNKTDLVRFLAIELSLGGLYAEELCLLLGVNKKTMPSAITDDTAEKLLQSLQNLLNSKPSPSIILENSKPIDVVPISLKTYKNNELKQFSTFSNALESYYSSTQENLSTHDKEITRLQSIIDQQREAIETSQQAIKQNSARGQLIYQHYQEVKTLLEEINSTRKTGGWNAVKQLRKTNKKLKAIDEEKGKIVVDL